MSSPSHEHRADAAIFAIALALRLAWVGYVELRGGGLFGPDAPSYDALAVNLLAGRGLEKQDYGGLFSDPRESLTVRAFRPPLLPVVLAGVYGVFGHSHRAARIFLALVSAATCVVVARLARRIFDERTGAVAGMLMAVYPKFIYYAGAVVTETPCTFLLAAAMAVLVAAAGAERGGWRWAAGGALLGLAALARSSLLAFPAAVVLWVLVVRRRRGRAVGEAALVVAGFVAAMAPWWVRNWQAFGAFVPATTEGGYTLWVTNNARADGGGHCFWPEERGEFDGLDEVQIDRAFARKGVAYIRAHPGRFLELAGAKFVRFWRPWPHADEVGTEVALIGGLAFVPVLLLALWGAAVSLARWRPLLLFYLALAYFTALHMVFMAITRYRVPLVPYLIVLAAWGASDLGRRLGYCGSGEGLGPPLSEA